MSDVHGFGRALVVDDPKSGSMTSKTNVLMSFFPSSHRSQALGSLFVWPRKPLCGIALGVLNVLPVPWASLLGVPLRLPHDHLLRKGEGRGVLRDYHYGVACLSCMCTTLGFAVIPTKDGSVKAGAKGFFKS